MHFENTWYSVATNCSFENALYAGLAYGIVISAASQDISASKLFGKNLRHLVTIGGGSERIGIGRRLNITQATANAMQSHGFDTHAACEYVTYSNNIVDTTAGHGIYCEGGKTTLTNNTIRGCTYDGILVTNYTNRGLDYSIQNNTIAECGRAGISVLTVPISVGVDDHTILRNWKNCVIANNTITDATLDDQYAGIWLSNGDYATYKAKYAQIINNHVYLNSGTAGAEGIIVQGFDEVKVANNSVTNNVEGMGINFSRSTNGDIHDNKFYGTSDADSYGIPWAVHRLRKSLWLSLRGMRIPIRLQWAACRPGLPCRTASGRRPGHRTS